MRQACVQEQVQAGLQGAEMCERLSEAQDIPLQDHLRGSQVRSGLPLEQSVHLRRLPRVPHCLRRAAMQARLRPRARLPNHMRRPRVRLGVRAGGLPAAELRDEVWRAEVPGAIGDVARGLRGPQRRRPGGGQGPRGAVLEPRGGLERPRQRPRGGPRPRGPRRPRRAPRQRRAARRRRRSARGPESEFRRSLRRLLQRHHLRLRHRRRGQSRR
mmetsp:Transcript_44316/g.123275  ORF Transcript_44316/g.123275 Transcript_44316/m.123275 type:complete len:214 (-) Transcript_44316:51-692(-)